MKSRFETHGADTRFNGRSGHEVEVISEVPKCEFDYSEVGPMYRIRFNDGCETDAFLDELPDMFEYLFCEVIFDMTCAVASALAKLPNVELDSRELYSQVYTWAKEFEGERIVREDYLTEVEEFALKKFDGYLEDMHIQRSGES